MTTTLRPLALAAALLAGACLSPTASAAESYDNCTGFIDTLPATVTTQGVWCLRKNLTTAVTTGNAITVNGNNITIDCNDFKIGGLAAGASSQAIGIFAGNRDNTTVRGCGVRGFFRGIWLGGSGHLVEDNRLDGNLYVGISVVGYGNRIQRNRVFDTGGGTVFNISYGIYADADIVDNAVDNVFALGANSSAYGLVANGAGTEVRGNRVRNVLATGSGLLRGLMAQGSAIVVSGNQVSVEYANSGIGLLASGTDSFCTGNAVLGYDTAYSGCEYVSGNLPVMP